MYEITMQIYDNKQKKKDLKEYARANDVSMSHALWEAFYKLIGKPMPK